MDKQENKYNAVSDYFERSMPTAQTELRFANHFELLVAVILSAQCTDKRVNMVTPALFDALPNAEIMAKASVEQIFALIASISYPNAKAAHLHSMACRLTNKHGGRIPSTRLELEELAGVGRKTASVILAVAFGQWEFAVDTHVFRVAARIGLTKEAKNPLQAERQLVAGFSAARGAQILPIAHHWLILHGRYTCTARAPKCEVCGLSVHCDYCREL